MTEIQQKLLTYLGSCVFETEESPRLIPPQEEMTELFNLAENFALDQFLLYYYREHLSKELLQRARINYLTFAGEDVKHLRTLKEVERVLTENSIDYCLLKGSYLVKDIYPESSLRFRCDIDLLVRQADAKKAFKLLGQSGWEAEHGFIEVIENHLPTMTRRGYSNVEIHQHLFDKDNVNESGELWNCINNGDIDELLLAHLLKHAFVSHDFENGLKTLFDIGYMLKNKNIDFQKLATMEKKFCNFEFMPLVINSFKEFYPQNIQKEYKVIDSRLYTALREIIFIDLSWDKMEKPSLIVQSSLGGKGALSRGLQLFTDLSIARIALRFRVKNVIKIYLLYPFYMAIILGIYIKYSYTFLTNKQIKRSSQGKLNYLKNITIIKNYYSK